MPLFSYRQYVDCRTLTVEMLKAPAGLPLEGRYNMAGQSCFYFADNENGAINEVKKH